MYVFEFVYGCVLLYYNDGSKPLLSYSNFLPPHLWLMCKETAAVSPRTAGLLGLNRSERNISFHDYRGELAWFFRLKKKGSKMKSLAERITFLTYNQDCPLSKSFLPRKRGSFSVFSDYRSEHCDSTSVCLETCKCVVFMRFSLRAKGPPPWKIPAQLIKSALHICDSESLLC